MMKRNYYQERRLLLIDLLGGACVDCGAINHLEFDHVFPEDMSFRLAGGNINLKLEVVLKELQKCQLLCHSCHKKKTNLDFDRGYAVHGTPSTYSNFKCKCDDCRGAWKEYIKSRRKVLTSITSKV